MTRCAWGDCGRDERSGRGRAALVGAACCFFYDAGGARIPVSHLRCSASSLPRTQGLPAPASQRRACRGPRLRPGLNCGRAYGARIACEAVIVATQSATYGKRECNALFGWGRLLLLGRDVRRSGATSLRSDRGRNAQCRWRHAKSWAKRTASSGGALKGAAKTSAAGSRCLQYRAPP